ncbi:TetR/AcrR family transcriptional regulator [Pseudarthrobacter sp. C4D7]|jgi:AcrR family transcriptional regulator|uniref:TetR/AcrR family transcriptional regulator n=1 Tax=Pseudarthrobacter sp. C4D7 TaxID=2735268 RepID=UPI001584AC26|nr:TetR family transcriptional regulator [Pseudarthrobacter sp. C4D7]NUT72538.1 TetR family transcriptional regulator [Pseudarthrobacter sp. C4D7]
MAWNTERTKELLLAAATEEFSAKGLAGARVDRIAAAAGVNKERIYQYFGKKDELFDAVLAAEMIRVMTEVPITGSGPEAFGEYAGRLFDRHTSDGVLPRLLFWEGLERGGETVSRATRSDHCAIKVGQVLDVLPGIDRTDAADLLITVVTLCDGWPVLPQIDTLLAGGSPDRTTRRRAFIVRTATLLAEALAAEAKAAPEAALN